MLLLIPVLLLFGCVNAAFSTEPKIVNGENAVEGEFPYMVSLRRKTTKPGHFCGGSVLTRNWILTAAHCCNNILNSKPENFYAYTGSIYLSKDGRSNVMASAIQHEKYNASDKWLNDICLIKLATPLILDEKVQQITLPPQDWPVNSGDRVTITGWGLTERDDGSSLPDVLQKGVDFVAMSNSECKNRTGYDLSAGYLCARGNRPEQSTWNGDSGGPLVKNGVEVGLTSFGFRPFRPGNPTVYTRVTYYINWIKEKLGAEASELKFLKTNRFTKYTS